MQMPTSCNWCRLYKKGTLFDQLEKALCKFHGDQAIQISFDNNN